MAKSLDCRRRSIAMLKNITFEKVEEIIRIIERARDAAPDDRADDPHRGGPFGREGVSRPAPPPEPQPEADWERALGHYLADLPDAALGEVVGLYRYGRGDAASPQEAVAEAVKTPEPHAERVQFLSSRNDLATCLRRALDRL
jgi:hypothetical protein